MYLGDGWLVQRLPTYTKYNAIKICSNTNIGGINYEIIKYLILSFILLFMQQCAKMV